MTAINPLVPDGPITPVEARTKYQPILTPHEINEIGDFPEIFYLGQIASKLRVNHPGVTNHGFDDPEHHYKVSIGDHIAYRFEIRSVIGKGAFGEVLRCYDHKLKIAVALKVIVNTELMQEQGRVECSIIRHLNEADSENSHHIIRGIDFFMFRKHICIVTEIMGQNLYEYARSMRFRPCPVRQTRPIARQILEALAFVHANNVVHCDMKPENVLLEPGTFERVKIIDFGSGCFAGKQRYEYIQSRFYRAPEVIFGIEYGPPMDVWSFACVIIELMIGKPIFPGDTERDVLEMCAEILGAPPSELLMQAPRRREFFAADGSFHPVRGRRSRQPGAQSLEHVLGTGDPLLVDLLKKCLEWDQTVRITAAEALNHAWFSVKEIQVGRVSANHVLPGLIR
jgi:dual specificity tyrosine-phosphorylation-regulated kinase 2/3/4